MSNSHKIIIQLKDETTKQLKTEQTAAHEENGELKGKLAISGSVPLPQRKLQ